MTDRPGQPSGEGTPAPPPGWSAPPPGAPTTPAWGSPPPSTDPQRAATGASWQQPAPPPGPAGPPPSWHQLPPDDLARMHQPGIIPLRPLFVGDIFGGALQTMRRNPAATIGTGFLVLTVLLVPSYLASLAVLQVGSLAAEDRGVLVSLVAMLFSVLASVALTGMIVHVVGEAVLGDRAGLGDTWRAVRGRIPALIGTLVLISLLLAAVAVVAVLAFVLLGWLASNAGDLAVVLVVVVGVIAVLLLFVWAGVRLTLAPAAVVLERVGPWRGIRRAWSLTTGRQGWRVIGITLLASIITNIFTTAVQVPATLGVFLLGDIDVMADESLVDPLLVGFDHLVQLVVGAFVVPFTAGVTALLYLDQRIRREGLETSLLQAAQARAAARRS